MFDQILQFDINILAIILLVTLLVIIRIKDDLHSYSSRLFMIIILVTMAALVLEPATWIADAYTGPVARFLDFLTNWLLVLTGPVLVGFWISYADYRILHDRARIRRRLYYQYSSMLFFVLLLVNLFTPVFFGIRGDNEYFTGPIFFLTWLNMIVHFVYAVVLLIVYRKRTGATVIRGVTAYFILPAVGVLLQTIRPSLFFAWPMLALGIFVTYVFLETTSGTRDSLTGLYSRARFEEYLRYLRENHDPFGLLMIDLDDFKSVNDAFGHQTGDAVLVRFAAILRGAFAPESMIARIGGDEFMIVTAVTDAELAQRIADVRRTIADPKNVPALRTLRFSFGFVRNDPELTTDALLSAVDHRMYEDKARR
jgi:diguanylate cyclase (GGDEF)-like protein